MLKLSTGRKYWMPAYYLLMWVTPEILIANIGNTIKGSTSQGQMPRIPHLVESCWFVTSRPSLLHLQNDGETFGRTWKSSSMMMTDSGVKILYNSQIVAIKRHKVRYTWSENDSCNCYVKKWDEKGEHIKEKEKKREVWSIVIQDTE